MQNKYLIYIFIFSSILFFSCRKEFTGEIDNSQKPVEAVTKIPIYYPLKSNTDYIYLSEDYELIKVTELGEFSVMKDLSDLFPELPDLNTRYKYVDLFYSPDSTQLVINSVIENITDDSYYSAKVIKLDTSGNIISDELVDFPSLDSTFTINFEDHWISQNKYTWLFSAEQRPQNQNRLVYAIQYDINNQTTTDTSFSLISRGDIIYEIKENNKLYEFSFRMNNSSLPILRLHVLDENLSIVDSSNYNLNIDEIYFSQKLSNGNYFIAGSNSNFLSESASPYDIIAEINLNGNTIFSRNQSIVNSNAGYFYYNDLIEMEDSFIIGGYYATDWGFYDITDYKSSTIPTVPFSYIVGSANQDSERLIKGSYSSLGFSSTIGINKASYGYTALVYYTEFAPNTDSYLWLFKYDNDLKLINN